MVITLSIMVLAEFILLATLVIEMKELKEGNHPYEQIFKRQDAIDQRLDDQEHRSDALAKQIMTTDHLFQVHQAEVDRVLNDIQKPFYQRYKTEDTEE